MQRLIKLVAVVICLLMCSGCAAVAALPAFGVAGYFTGKEIERASQQKSDDPAAQQPVVVESK
jgi:hypothetical protein